MSTIERFRAAPRHRGDPDRQRWHGRRARRPRHRVGRVRRLLRHRSVWLIAVGVTFVLTVSAVRAEYETATALQRGWGDSVRVLVATSPIEPGDVIGDHNTEPRAWPVAVAPPTVHDRLEPNDRATASIAVGEPVLADDVGDPSEPGTLPPATAAVGVPLGATSPRLEAGDTVDVHATFDPTAESEPPTSVVARRAVVIAVDDRVATLAVAVDEIDAVTSALVRASITVVLRDR